MTLPSDPAGKVVEPQPGGCLLETPRLTLRLVGPEDADFVCELLNEPSFIQNIGDRGIRTPQQAPAYIAEKLVSSYDVHGYGLYVVQLRATGESLGICGFVKREFLAHPDIGFAFLDCHGGQGYVFESASAVLAYGRSRLGLVRVHGITTSENARSQALLQKLGLRLEREIAMPGSDQPRLLYSLEFPLEDTPAGAAAGLPPVPSGYLDRMPRQAETLRLDPIGLDVNGREARLSPKAAVAWRALHAAAGADGLALLLVSSFRSFERQREIVAAKLRRGESLEAVLRTSAYPGFSEHHTGLAVDLGSPGHTGLTEQFETTREFSWLVQNAGRFGFSLTYPRGNRHAVAYEPWHWCYRPGHLPRPFAPAVG